MAPGGLERESDHDPVDLEGSGLMLARFLLVSDAASRFVEQDRRILEGIGPTSMLIYRGRRDLPRLARAILATDVTLCWFVLGYATTSTIVSRILGKPTVVVAGGWDVVAMPELGFGAMLFGNRVRKTRQALRMATAVAAVSESTQSDVLRWVNRKVTVIPNGVDLTYFRPNAAARQRQVVTVAGVSNEPRFRVKGIEFLMEIAARMPDITFYLAGRTGGVWADRIKGIAPPNVRMVGFLNDGQLRALYQESRVYLQPSAYEAFGLSLAEAMACECYPVVTNRGAMPEVVGGVGSVVSFGDLEGAIDAIRKGLEVEGCHAASARVRERFSLDQRKRLLSQLVERILTGEGA